MTGLSYKSLHVMDTFAQFRRVSQQPVDHLCYDGMLKRFYFFYNLITILISINKQTCDHNYTYVVWIYLRDM